MRQGQLLRIPFQPPQFDLLAAELHREMEATQLFLDGEGGWFGRAIGQTGHRGLSFCLFTSGKGVCLQPIEGIAEAYSEGK